MKKLLSIMLAMAMVLSLVIVAAIPASAIEGQWTVTATAKQENGEIGEDEYNSVAGYEYDANGLHMTAANWAGQTPWARFVTKTKVDLKEGVYMEIVVDEFDYSAADAWFNVMITDIQYVTPGAAYEGDAVQNLIRANEPANTTAWFLEGGFKQQTMHQGYENVPVVKDADEKHTLTVVIAWDGATFTYTINGTTAPQSVIDYMNTIWGGDNSEAYVAFCLQHNTTGGSVAASLVKYGTSAENATVPTGDDEQAPKDYSLNHAAAPVVTNPTFEAGQPGIFLNGDIENSNVKNIPGSVSGESLSVNEDGSIHVVAHNKSTSTGAWIVENATSYAIEDLPIAMMVTKNLCTCSEEDKYDGICGAMEESTVYLLTGNKLAADNNCMTTAEVSWDAYVIGDDTYLSIMLDATGMESTFSGRINGIRFDVSGLDMDTPGANEFDLCFVAFFATEEDANAYFEAYLTNLGWENPDAGEDDVTTEEETTVAGEDETTVAGEDETTGADDVTTAPQGGSTDTPAKKGCKGVVGFGAVAVVAVASVAGFVSFKKKED